MQTEEKVKALYARLSIDDDGYGDSNSIKHQKAILSEYAISQGFKNYRFYVDDGITGTTFNRPDFIRMISDIESGIVDTVIVKDLSRFGRDYLKVGYYTEIVFPEYDVRFISISDNVDSAKNANYDIIPFHNLMNEWYARDISKKQRAVVQNKGRSGGRLTNRPIYGYKYDENKNWIIDEEAAKVVRTIFDLYTNGKGMYEIANYLFANKIKAPSAHQNIVHKGSILEINPYIWSTQSVSMILSKQEYCGDTVNFRTTKKSYKSKKIILNNEDDYVIFLNTQEAIIDRETFEKAKALRSKRIRRTSIREPALFANVIFCADCKSKMYVIRARNYKKKNADPSYYTCSGYRKTIRKCTAHYIRECVLCKYVLSILTQVFNQAKSNPLEFKQKVTDEIVKRHSVEKRTIQKELSQTEDRIKELDEILKNLYIDKLQKNISQEVFANLSSQVTQEQSELREKEINLSQQLAENNKSSSGVSRFFQIVNKYDSIDELTYDVIHDFIERIEVHEIVEDKKRTQKIDVFFIGLGLINYE